MNLKKILAVTTALLLASSCGQPQKSTSSQTTETFDKTTLTIALSSEPAEGFDPCVGWGRYGSPLIQSTLVKLDSSLNITHDLATDYTVTDDGLTWTFTIRDDVLFSNGEKLTPNDVAFTFQTAKNSGSVVDLSALKNVTTNNSNRVIFTLHQPQITFIYTVAQTGIVPASHYDSNYYQSPIGSGPFTLEQWDKGEQVILGVNPYYYGTTPNFTQVNILFMTEETAFAACQKGIVDLAITNPNYAATTVNGMTLQNFTTVDNRGVTLPTLPNTGETTTNGYPIGNDVTADLSVRQALSIGINRELLIEHCLNGYGTPAFSQCDNMPWGNENLATTQDTNSAIQLLENNGWILNPTDNIRYKDHVKASFTLLYNASDTVRQALSLAFAQQAKTLGIEIIVEGTSWDEIDKRMYSNPVLMGWGSQTPMESYYLYHSENMGLDYYNPEYYSSPETDELLSSALSTTDYDLSMSFFKQAQYTVTQQMPWVWLVNMDHLYFVRDGLDLGEQKIHPHGHAWPIVSNMTEWKYIL